MAFFRRFSPIAAVALVAAVAAPQAAGSVFTPGPLTQASLLNPLADCPPDGAGVNFVNAEVEPFLGVNPRNDANLIGGLSAGPLLQRRVEGLGGRGQPDRRRDVGERRDPDQHALHGRALSARVGSVGVV